MMQAFILINIENIDPVQVGEDVTMIEGVENVHQTRGEYELVARVETESEITLREEVVPAIEKIKGVAKTSILEVTEDQSE